ncbi:MAG: hypothetical protein ABI867_44635 [Kofleriaceae bacterium]
MTKLALIVLLAACERSAPPSTPAPVPAPKRDVAKVPVDLPVVTKLGYAEISGDDHAMTVVATPSALSVEGKAIASIRNGAFDPAELEGGALGIKLPRLTDFTAAFVQASPTTTRARLMLDAATPYRVLFSIMYSMKPTLTRFDLVARVGEDLVTCPVVLPERKQVSSGVDLDQQIRDVRDGKPVPPPTNVSLKLWVSVTATEVLVWSVSGLEGTLKTPASKLPLTSPSLVTDLRKVLADIAQRHADRDLVIQADGAVPLQRIAEILGAVRATPTGAPMFVDVVFATGF